MQNLAKVVLSEYNCNMDIDQQAVERVQQSDVQDCAIAK